MLWQGGAGENQICEDSWGLGRLVFAPFKQWRTLSKGTWSSGTNSSFTGLVEDG